MTGQTHTSNAQTSNAHTSDAHTSNAPAGAEHAGVEHAGQVDSVAVQTGDQNTSDSNIGAVHTGVVVDEATEPQSVGDLPDGSGGLASAPATPAAAEMVPEHDLFGALEAVLLVVDAPVTEVALATAVGHRPVRIRELLLELADRYTAAASGIELRELGGGWRFYTRDRFAPVVERFVLDGAQGRLSRAALETLAVVAYRQPVTRARVSGVRGVNVDGVIRTLMSRGLIEDVGADPDTGGQQYRTTDLFLERLGLSDLSELPSLGPLLPDIEGIDDV